MKGGAGPIINKFWVFLVLGVVASAVGLGLYRIQLPFLEGVDQTAGDARFKARGEVIPSGDVVIVAIDEKSINELGRWPWPRTTMAKLVQGLAAAKVQAYDIVFSETETIERDAEIGGAVKNAGNVVLGYFLRDDSTSAPEPAALEQLDASKIKFIKVLDDTEFLPIPEFYGIETNIPIVGEGAGGFGLFNIFPDENDGVVRRAQLAFLYNGDIYPSLALEALRYYYKGDIVMQVASYGVDRLYIDNRMVPVDEYGRFRLNFYGKGGIFQTYSAVDVINGELPAEAIKDKIVFIGATEKAIYDLRVTPLDPVLPGVEVHATVAANVLEGRYLFYDSRVAALDIFLLILLPLGLCLSLTWIHRTLISLVLFLSILSLHAVINYHLFSLYNIIPSMIYPAISLSLAYLSAEAYRNLVVENRGRYLRKAFGTYVSPALVAEILKDPDKLKLGGEKREITTLFSDIRGFTSLSEKLSPEELVTLLNEYLSPMTKIVLEEKGTLDKYIGDAIMVICNAPLDLPDHAEKGCSIALRWMDELEKLNNRWKEKSYPVLGIGVGISTGDAVVGNMGAELRFDYTAIGDTVNLASRLEGMNKIYDTKIIVSENTQKRVQNNFIFRELDMVRVKGKENPVSIYELIGFSQGGALSEELAKMFSEALMHYKNREFKEAKARFTAIFDRFPGDGPAKLYIQRCADYIGSPPSPEWDGVYIAKTK